MKKQNPSNPAEPALREMMQTLKDVPSPEPTLQRRMQADFLHQIHAIQAQSVTIPQKTRLNHQEKPTKYFFNRWRTSSMTVKILAILIASVTLFSAAGAGTVYAAQSALPDEALYPVKLWSEEVRLDWSQTPDRDVALHLAFADRRVDEMVALADAGKPIDNELQIELQTHLWMAARLAQQTEDPIQAQNQLRNTLMNQEMKLNNVPEDAAMTQTRTMLRQQIRLMDCETEGCEQEVCAEGGCLNDEPLMTQDQVRDQLRTNQPEGAGNEDANGMTGDYPEPKQGNTEGNGNGSGNQEGGNQENPGQKTQTPEPGTGQQNGEGNGNGKGK